MANLYSVDDRVYTNTVTGEKGSVKVAVFVDVTYGQMNELLNAVNHQFQFFGCVIDNFTMGCPVEGRYFYTRMLGEGFMVELASLDIEYAHFAESVLGIAIPAEVITK
jgi:hypothetical protein